MTIMTRTITELEEAVDKGSKLLDTEYPEWHEAVDLDTFEIVDVDYCVLGQVYGGYAKGINKLGMNYGGSLETHGFYLHTLRNEPWHELQALWIDAILARRKDAAS